jgi:hypothetical protein
MKRCTLLLTSISQNYANAVVTTNKVVDSISSLKTLGMTA